MTCDGQNLPRRAPDRDRRRVARLVLIIQSAIKGEPAFSMDLFTEGPSRINPERRASGQRSSAAFI